MPMLAVLCAVLGAAFLLLLLVFLSVQRRHRAVLGELTRELHRIAVGGSLRSRLEVSSDDREVSALVTVVNHLLTRAGGAAEPQAQVAPAAPLTALGERLHEAVLLHSARGILYANAHFASLVGAPAAELVGRPLSELVPDEYAELVGDNIRHRLAGEPAAERYEIDLLGLQGQHARLELSSWPVEHLGQPALLVVGVEVLPTLVAPAPGQLPGARSRARMTLESLPTPVVGFDAHGRIDFANAAAAELLGLPGEAAHGLQVEEFARILGEGERALLVDPVRQALASGAPLALGRRAISHGHAGNERLLEVSVASLRDEAGNTHGAVLALHDVTETRGAARQISYQAAHDALTGLVNRREFERRLDEALAGARKDGHAHVLCYLDLDRFKLINDSSGHQAGDALLRDIAKLVRGAVRDSDTVGRLGGDEFGLLLVGCPLDKARQIADDVCRKVADHRFVWRDRIFNVGASIGLVEVTRESGSIEEVIAAADSACYVAKRQGGHISVYSARDEAFARQTGEIQWLRLLQGALKDNRFELYSQPIVAAYGNGESGPALEVLVRLRDEDGQAVVTADLLQAAERYRLMGLIDRHVVQTTLNALGRGALLLPPGRSLALNISGQTLADTQFLEFVVESFDATGADPALVCFEISEGAVVANLEQARRFIGVLHGMGCRFALDDFGSGLGSFANLKNLAVDFLKIDGSFIGGLARDSVNQAMVGAMIKLARTLNFRVIAEQVEDEAAVDAARAIGCDFLQGYALGRPEPLAIAA